MRRAHIAIYNISAPVHVHPTLALVAALVKRGHRVTYDTSAKFEQEIRALGAEVVNHSLLDIRDPDSAERGGAKRPPPIDAMLRAAESFYKRHPPDLILYDALVPAALVLASNLGISAIRMTPQLPLYEHLDGEDSYVKKTREILKHLRKKTHDFLSRHGVDFGDDLTYSRTIRTIYFYVRDVQRNQEIDDGQSIYAGRCASERPMLRRWDSKRCTGQRCILVSSSTAYVQQFQYFNVCVQALAGLGYHIVLALGNNIEVTSLAPLPSTSEIVQNIPQLLVMPHMELMICLGGMTTTMEAMYHGLPLLMLTHGAAEAEVYAENNQRLGLGIHLKGAGVAADRIRDGVIRITKNETIKRSVMHMQRQVRQSPGAEDVSIWIESLLR